MSCDPIRGRQPNGFSLVECLVLVALLGILATLAIPSSSAVQRRLELDSGLRRLRVGLDRGRMAASAIASPVLCSSARMVGGLRRRGAAGLPWGATALAEAGADELELRSNLRMPFASAPMAWCSMAVVVLFHPSQGEALCLVIGLPLGISRTGVYRGIRGS